MGLDMYAYKAEKLSEKETDALQNTDLNHLPDGIRGFTISGYTGDGSYNLIKALKPYFETVNLKTDYINMEQIRKDYGIPDEAYLSGQSFSKEAYGYIFRNKDDSKEISIPVKDLMEKYVFTETEPTWVLRLKEVHYWRKNYDLSNELESLSPVTVENCGYYACTTAMIDAMNRAGADIDPDEDGIFYEEWY